MKKLNLWTKVHSFAALICAAALLVLAGCENVAVGDKAASNSRGLLRISISDSLSLSQNSSGVSASVGGISKTAIPENFASYWDKYILTFAGGTQSDITVLSTDTGKISNNVITVEVAPGNYTITITAYKGDVAAAKGTVAADLSGGGTVNTEPVAMMPKTTADDDSLQNGSLAYSINLTGLTGLSKKILYFKNGDAKVTTVGDSGDIALTENSANSSTASLPPGFYKVYVNLEKSGETAGLYGDFVYIYSQQTSTLPAMAFTEANFSASGGDDPSGSIGSGLEFAGTIEVTGWENDLEISKTGGTHTFSISGDYTNIEWYLNETKVSTSTSTSASYPLDPAKLSTKTYTLMVIAQNGSGLWESSGGLFVTITE